MKVKLLEVPTASSTAEIPTVKKQEPMPTEAQSDTPSLTSAVTGYQHVQGTGFSVYTSVDLNERSRREFCWVEIKSISSQLSKNQDEVRKTCRIRFALFRVENVDVPPSLIQIRWEFDSAGWK